MKSCQDGLKCCGDNPDLTNLVNELKPLAERAEAALRASMTGPEILKAEGNELFKAAKFELAIEKYTQVIEKVPYTYGEPMDPLLISCYNNRAACNQQLGAFRKVTEDCSIVIEQDPRNIKALLRRGLALESLEKFRGALQDIRAVLAIDGTVAMANQAQHRLGSQVRRMKAAKK